MTDLERGISLVWVVDSYLIFFPSLALEADLDRPCLPLHLQRPWLAKPLDEAPLRIHGVDGGVVRLASLPDENLDVELELLSVRARHGAHMPAVLPLHLRKPRPRTHTRARSLARTRAPHHWQRTCTNVPALGSTSSPSSSNGSAPLSGHGGDCRARDCRARAFAGLGGGRAGFAVQAFLGCLRLATAAAGVAFFGATFFRVCRGDVVDVFRVCIESLATPRPGAVSTSACLRHGSGRPAAAYIFL
jgi:hypothetical protein